MMNLTYNLDELDYYTPELTGWRSAVFLVASALVMIITMVVQATIYKTLKRLGSRYINQIIIPSQLLFNIVTPINLLITVAKSIYYPLADITGTSFCHVENYLLLWSFNHSSFLTFFITTFRYICLFQDDNLITWSLSPKNLGRICVGLQLIITTTISAIILQTTASNRGLDACLGHFEEHFLNSPGQHTCTNGGFILNNLCYFSIFINVILSSNIPELFMLYSCFKFIRDRDERAKSMIGEKHYLLRKKDNGIVINISIVQWIIEFINFIFYYSYVIFLQGASNFADKFFILYMLTFTMIIQPSFYLSGDAEFRRNLVNHGLFVAFKWALKS